MTYQAASGDPQSRIRGTLKIILQEEITSTFSVTDIEQTPFKRELMHEKYLQNDVSKLPFRSVSFETFSPRLRFPI